MADVYQLARRQRAQLIAGERDVLRRLAADYQTRVVRPLEAELERLNARADRLMARDGELGPATLFQQGRLDRMLAEARARMAAFSGLAQRTTKGVARDALHLALGGQPELVDAATPPGFGHDFTGARPDAIEAAIAQSQTAAAGLQAVNDQQVQLIGQQITEHVARGRHPRELARVIRDQAGLPLTRALTIARTEQLRAYRTGSHLTYQQARDVLAGWVWLSAADARTCAVCWAMHGTLHPVDEVMGSHPNCRCVPVPQTRPWSQLGGDPELEPRRPDPGPVLFDRLPIADKRRILGPAGLRMYQQGELDLVDLVQPTVHRVYGPGIRRRPLAQAAAMKPEPGRTRRTLPDRGDDGPPGL